VPWVIVRPRTERSGASKTRVARIAAQDVSGDSDARLSPNSRNAASTTVSVLLDKTTRQRPQFFRRGMAAMNQQDVAGRDDDGVGGDEDWRIRRAAPRIGQLIDPGLLLHKSGHDRVDPGCVQLSDKGGGHPGLPGNSGTKVVGPGGGLCRHIWARHGIHAQARAVSAQGERFRVILS
jgi:hypothetical protein